MKCLLDTDVASQILKAKNRHVARHAADYLRQYARFSLSLITRYEILRGYKYSKATAQMAVFRQWCSIHDILDVTDEIVEIAADIYAGLRRSGQPIGDADILIAATALHHGLALATANIAHFSRIPNLTLEDWTKP